MSPAGSTHAFYEAADVVIEPYRSGGPTEAGRKVKCYEEIGVAAVLRELNPAGDAARSETLREA